MPLPNPRSVGEGNLNQIIVRIGKTTAQDGLVREFDAHSLTNVRVAHRRPPPFPDRRLISYRWMQQPTPGGTCPGGLQMGSRRRPVRPETSAPGFFRGCTTRLHFPA